MPLLRKSAIVPAFAWSAILIAFGAMLIPDIARAACGDYITVAGKKGAGKSELHGFATAASNRHLALAIPSSPARPCRGPNCGRMPTEPTSPPSIPIAPKAERLAIVELRWPLAAKLTNFSFDDDPLAVEPTPVREIFHPPRV